MTGRFDPLQGVIVNKDGTPSVAMQVYWQKFRESLEAALGNIEDLLDSILALPIIEAAVAAAQAAAVAAQAAADSVTDNNNISDSWVEGLTLEAFNDGADCHVDISAHNRVYADGTTVAINGGTLPAIAHNTVVRVYYDDPTRAGGAVTYAWTSDPTVAAQVGNRHAVGATVTPRALEMTSVIGSPTLPPGASFA